MKAHRVTLAACTLLFAACSAVDLPRRSAELDDVLDPDNPALDEESGHEAFTDEDPDDLYSPDRLPVFKLTLSSDAQERLGATPREYVPAILELIDGDVSEQLDVGVKLKGHGSFRQLDGKAAFRIKIDRYVEGQRLRGLRALTLNNMLQDRSLVAERLAYYIFRELGAPAPKANHAQVFVNDVYYGIYANIETSNEDFLVHWFQDPERNLYEQSGKDFDHENGAKSFELETNEKQPDNRAHLFELQEACIAHDLARARELVDWPKFMLFAALEGAVNQVDGYSYAQKFTNNFRIYDSEGGIVFIPAGLDWALGKVAVQDDSLFLDPFWVRPTHGVLLRMCLEDEACTEEFRATVQMVATRWDDLKLEDRMDEWLTQIDEAFFADERRERPIEIAWASQDIRRDFIRGRAQSLFDALERHAAK
jgi:hypothetical protein